MTATAKPDGYVSPHSLALESLRAAAQHVEDLQRRVEELEGLLQLSRSPGVVAALVAITKRRPEYHVGHLDADAFELVRELLGVAPGDVLYRDHGDGHRYFIIECETAGLLIRAQRHADDEAYPAPKLSVVEAVS